MRKSPKQFAAVIIIAALFTAAALLRSPASAQTPFYQGKTMTIITGSQTGDLYDIYARMVATHMGKHISGAPSILVQHQQTRPIGGEPGRVSSVVGPEGVAAATGIRIPAPSGDWRTDLGGIARALRVTLMSQPALVEVVISRPALGPGAIYLAEAAYAVFVPAGFGLRTTDRAANLLFGYVLGFAALEAPPARRKALLLLMVLLDTLNVLVFPATFTPAVAEMGGFFPFAARDGGGPWTIAFSWAIGIRALVVAWLAVVLLRLPPDLAPARSRDRGARLDRKGAPP